MSVRCPDGHLSDSTDYCDTCGLPIGAASSSNLDLGPAPTVPSPLSLVPPLPAGEDKPCPNCNSLVPIDDLFCEVCGYDFTTGALPTPITAPGGVPVAGSNSAQLGGGAVVTPAPGGPALASVRSGSGSGAGSGSGVGAGGQGGSGVGSGGAGGVGSSTGLAVAGSAGPAGSGSGSADPDQLIWVAEVWVDPDWYATQESDEPCPSAGMPVVMPLWDTSVLVGRRSASRNIHPQVDCGADHGVSRRHAQLTTDGQRWWVEDLQSSNGTFVGPAGAPIPTVPVSPGQRTEFSPGDRVYVGAWTRIVVRKATPDEQ
jgi:hypothetical protein